MMDTPLLEPILRPLYNRMFLCSDWPELFDFAAEVKQLTQRYLQSGPTTGSLICFGAGSNGRLICRTLERLGRRVDFFCDNRPELQHTRLDGRYVLAPDELPGLREALIFISPYDQKAGEAIRAQLRALGLAEASMVQWPHEIFKAGMLLETIEAFGAGEADFRRVYSMLDDERSRFIYLNVLKARMSLFDQQRVYHMISEGAAYWPLPQFRNTLPAVFVDVGAWTGDTVESFLHNNLKNGFKKIYAFEPGPEIFKRLQCNTALMMEKFQLAAGSIECLNLAVGGPPADRPEPDFPEMDLPQFMTQITLTPTLGGCEHEGELAMESFAADLGPTVTLDDFFGPAPVDYIKIDAEGGDWAVVNGAAALIKRCRPLLAVSIYHRPTDLYTIPLLIKKLVPEYNLAVRHHGTNVFDTVLYCWT